MAAARLSSKRSLRHPLYLAFGDLAGEEAHKVVRDTDAFSQTLASSSTCVQLPQTMLKLLVRRALHLSTTP
jgi:hypothetical protein